MKVIEIDKIIIWSGFMTFIYHSNFCLDYWIIDFIVEVDYRGSSLLQLLSEQLRKVICSNVHLLTFLSTIAAWQSIEQWDRTIRRTLQWSEHKLLQLKSNSVFHVGNPNPALLKKHEHTYMQYLESYGHRKQNYVWISTETVSFLLT